jgi:hypothetical protein
VIAATPRAPDAGASFPEWAAALRALAYNDRRGELRDLASEAPASGSSSMQLVIAEARLECAAPGTTRPDSLDPGACAPVSPAVAHLWRDWLVAESDWCTGARPSSELLAVVDELLQRPAPPDGEDGEWRRLTQRAAVLGARCALECRDTAAADRYLATAERTGVDLWEVAYVAGLLAWSQGNAEGALEHLEGSLRHNPSQARVRFELALLRAGGPEDLTALPGVADAASEGAAALARLGRTADARVLLEQLRRPEAPYSLRLVWPRARAARIGQGEALLARLAEPSIDRMAPRAHRLYLLGRELGTRTPPSGDPDNSLLYVRFQKELAAMGLRVLTGDSMFYRALAAEPHDRQRSAADARALLRQTGWLARTASSAPAQLVCLGDLLVRLGLAGEAVAAYERAAAAGVDVAPERCMLAKLAAPRPASETDALDLLETQPLSAPGLGSLLRGLCALAREATDSAHGTVARQLFARCRQEGLAGALPEACERLASLAAGEPGAREGAAALLSATDLRDLPAVLRLGLSTILRPEGAKTLRCWQAEVGDAWADECPLAPLDVVALHLHASRVAGDPDALLADLIEAERLPLAIPAEWLAYGHAKQALRLGLAGEFVEAQAAHARALDCLLSGGPA